MQRLGRPFFGVALAFVILGAAPSAQAKRTGMNLPCHNCHEGQNKPKITAMLSSARVEAGQPLTITITAVHPTAKVGGVLLDSKGVGTIELVDPVGTRLFDNTTTQATHAMPQQYMNGQVQFSFRWIAPAMVGTADFDIFSNAGNDNLMPMDDSPGEILEAVSVGCDALWYYLDADMDGAGAEKTRLYSCQPMPDRITAGGDCDDKNPQTNVHVAEICNSVDDDCDGQIDEGFVPVLLTQDADGDGYGARAGMSMIGCPPQPGFAPNFDDCNDTDPTINPGAAELMNGRDDNCDRQVDEAAMPGNGAAPLPAADAGGCSVVMAAPSSLQHFAAPLLLAWAYRRRTQSRRR